MSLSRTFEPFSRYSLSPERYRRRVTRTSAYSIGRLPSELSRTSETSAIPSGWREAEPAKMTSSGLRARTALADCSPRTHNTPSAMLDLPLPFGPTTTTIPGKNSVDVRAAKDLKPTSSRRFRNMADGSKLLALGTESTATLPLRRSFGNRFRPAIPTHDAAVQRRAYARCADAPVVSPRWADRLRCGRRLRRCRRPQVPRNPRCR